VGSATGIAGSAQKSYRTRAPDRFITLNAVAAGGAVWTPGSTRAFRLVRLVLFCGTAGTIVLTDGNGGTTLVVAPVAANAPLTLDFGPAGLPSIAGNATPLWYASGGPGAVSGMLIGTEE